MVSVPTVGVPPQVGEAVGKSGVGGFTVGEAVGTSLRRVILIVEIIVGAGVSIPMEVGLAVPMSSATVGFSVSCGDDTGLPEGSGVDSVGLSVSLGMATGLSDGEKLGFLVGMTEGDKVGCNG